MSASALIRFMSKTAPAQTGCLLWTPRLSRGYGHFSFEGRYMMAHVWHYEQVVGPVPDGKELDHLCRVRHCVLIAHLEPVTSRVNKLRGDGPRLLSLQRRPDPTKCGKGLHDWVEENIYHTTSGDRCKPCTRAYNNAWRKEAG